MSFINPSDERIFAQVTIPWTATAATLATADGIQIISARLNAQTNEIQSRVKTGSLGRAVGRRGRRLADFSLTVPFKGSGTAGTAGDIDQILQAIFGAAPVISAGVSVTYNIAEVNAGLTIGKFRDPSGANMWDEVLVGGLVDSWEIAFGEEAEAELTVSGPAVDVIDKPNFASLSTLEKRGLASFPSEPVAPTFLGLSALAFVGSISINGVTTFSIATGRIYGTMARTIRYAFGNYYVTVPIANIRTIGFDFSLYEEDTAAQAALRQLGRTRGAFDAIIALGDVAGNINTFTIKNMTASAPNADDAGQESILPFSATAAVSSAVLNDEIKLVQT